MRGVVLQAPLCGTISAMLVAEQIPSFMAFGVCIRNCTSAVPVDFYLIFFCYGYLPYNATNSKRVTFLHLLYVYLCTAAGWGEGRGGYYWGMYETSLCCVIGVCVCLERQGSSHVFGVIGAYICMPVPTPTERMSSAFE